MKTLNLASITFAAMVACTLGAGAARAEIKTQPIDYKQGDTALRGYLVYDDAVTGKRPGILMAHDRSGLSANTLKDAAMIAGLGYVVFAEDIFGKDVLPKTVPDMQATIAIYNKDRPLMRARAVAGLDVLRQSPLVDASKLALVGYCFGGTVAIETAETGAPLLATVSVHGSFRGFPAEAAKNIKGRVLILHGAEDQVAPVEEVNALIKDLRGAKVPFQLEMYSGAQHAFTAPQNASDERADREYKYEMARFLKEVFSS